MISLINITKKYKNGDSENIALDGLSLELPEKGLVAVFGVSGCGKSTLLNVIGGLDRFDSGDLIINGRNTKTFKVNDWYSYRNQHVGFVFQNYYLMSHLNVKENITLSAKLTDSFKSYDEEIVDILSKVDLTGFEKRMPKTLSGGQAQRVAIARALINRPSIILADEPTGALDKKSSEAIMKVLKEISKERLVVLVTHDEKLAKEYADRLIEISYGKIVSDTSKDNKSSFKEELKLKRTRLPFHISLGWGVGNVWRKKSRTIPLMIAGAIGFLAVGIVLSMTDQVNKYTLKAQEASLTKYPVAINCYLTKSAEGHTASLKQFPEEKEIVIEKMNYVDQERLPYIQQEFNNYMDQMPEEYYTGKYSNGKIYFKMLTKQDDDTYKAITSVSYHSKLPNNNDFIQTQYDLIEGKFPTNKTEIMLCIDSYNRVDVNKLKAIGFDTSGDRISFSKVIGKEYKFISNNLYYGETTVSGGNIRYNARGSTYYDEMYNDSSSLSLKIVGIVRDKSTDSSIFTTPLLYTDELAKYVVNDCHNSDIVTQQIAYKENLIDGKIIDIFTGQPFGVKTSSSYNLTENYQYEQNLLTLGNEEYATSLYFCTSTYEDRLKIADYFKAYEQEKDSDFVFKIRDYLETVSSSLSSIIDTFSMILLVFSMAAVIVSMLLTMVLTYISVLERYKEIGLLKSIGARKIDILSMFLVENLIIGIISGIIATVTGILISPLVGNVVVSMVRVYDTAMLTSVPLELGKFVGWVIPIIFAGTILSSILASLIPTMIGANKHSAEILKE